jgi:hypothetical protein
MEDASLLLDAPPDLKLSMIVLNGDFEVVLFYV